MPRVTFIYPCVGRFPKAKYVRSWQMQPLAIGVLSSLTPSSWQKSFFDDRLEPINFSEPTDLAAISIETFTARRGYQIAEEYRRRGVQVVIGGYHATLCPDEASEHADAVCIGEAEGVWRDILSDAALRKLERTYTGRRSSPLTGICPDRSIYAGKNYFKLAMVESGRGCRFKCSFCSISAFYQATYRRRPVDEIVNEVKRLKEKTIFFVDDNIVGDTPTARELFEALEPLKINWIGQSSINAAADPELLNLMSRSGCRGLLIGFESLDADNLSEVGKTVNQSIDYEKALTEFRKNRIMIYGTFMFGFAGDSSSSIRSAVDFARRQKMFLAAFAQIIPFPGTRLYAQFAAEQRLMYPSWWLNEAYRFGQAPYYRGNLSPFELEKSCLSARRDFYSFPSMLQRGTDYVANCRSPRTAAVFYGLNYLMHREVPRKFGIPMGFHESGATVSRHHVAAEIATPANDAEIRNLLGKNPVPGAVSIAYLRGPSYMESLKVEGKFSETVTGRDTDSGLLIGLGTRSVKNCFINGRESPIGYLGSLRLIKEYRGSNYLARGYRELKRLHQEGRVKLYLTTIIESNKGARAILTSGRAGLPAYNDYGRFCSMAISLRQKFRPRLPPGLAIRPADSEDIPAIIDFWRLEGPEKQFFPEYLERDFEPGGLLRGLKAEDILLAFQNGILAGTVGAWNQQSFRQSRVMAYNPWLGAFRPVYNSIARVIGFPSLPQTGIDLDYFNLSVVCIRNNDRQIFASLLSDLLSKNRGEHDFMTAGMHESDPLLADLKRYRHFTYASRLYIVCWDDGLEEFEALDRRVPYLELGAL